MNGNRTALIGLAVGLVGAVLLGVFVANNTGGAAVQGPMVSALVADQALPADLTVDQIATRVSTIEVPQALAPQRRVTTLTEVAGQRILRPVSQGELLTLDSFARPGPAFGGVNVPAGYEALSLEAEPAPGVEGYVTAGSRVNVYAILTDSTPDPTSGNPIAEPYSQLVLGHVDVLAVTRGTLNGESAEVSPDIAASQSRIVMLLQVRPEDVPVLVYAQSQGSLWFTLVNSDDPAPVSERVALPNLDPAVRTQAISEAIARRAAEEAAAQASLPAQPAGTAPTPTPLG